MALPVATIARTLLGRRGMGYLPSPADERDAAHAWQPLLGAGPRVLAAQDALAHHALLRNQGGTNSCTQHAVDYGLQVLCETDRGPRGLRYTPRSVAAPYYHGRVLNHLEDRDAGAVLRSVLKANAELGVPPESAWPLRARTINQQPGADTYRLGRIWRGLKYARIEGDRVQGTLEALSAGYPVVAGFEVDEAFLRNDGPADVLAFDSARPAAGHALALLGFTRTPGLPGSVRFRSPGSWGRDWRDGGWCNLGPVVVAGAFEAWVLRGWAR